MKIGLGLGIPHIRRRGQSLSSMTVTQAPTLTVPDPLVAGGQIDIANALITDPVYDSVTWQVRVNGDPVGHDLEADGPWTVAGDGADVITVVVRAVKAGHSDRVVTLGPLTLLEAPAVVSFNTSPSYVNVGVTVSVTDLVMTGYPAPTPSYQWFLNAEAISGATASSYTTVATGTLTVEVTATNSVDDDTLASGSITVNEFPADYTAPVVSNVSISPDPAIVGETLTALYDVTGTPTPTMTFQWKLNGSNVIGATSSTYSYFQGDEPGPITVAVTATNVVDSDTTESANTTLYAPPYGEGGGWEDVPDDGPTLGDAVLLENDDFLLLEDGTDKLLLEAV
jgi:hypothetical protein